jgi:hypothetical protein
MPLSGDQTDLFERFLDAYPKRDDQPDLETTREAWRRALARGADPETLIEAAEAYRRLRDGQPARFTMSARRWLSESCWRDVGAVSRPSCMPAPALVWVACGSAEWTAWSRYRGKSPPLDRRGGWRFPSRWPPSPPVAAE